MKRENILATYDNLLKLVEFIRESSDPAMSWKSRKLKRVLEGIVNRRMILEEILNSKDDKVIKAGLKDTLRFLKEANAEIMLCSSYSPQDVCIRLSEDVGAVIQKINSRL